MTSFLRRTIALVALAMVASFSAACGDKGGVLEPSPTTTTSVANEPTPDFVKVQVFSFTQTSSFGVALPMAPSSGRVHITVTSFNGEGELNVQLWKLEGNKRVYPRSDLIILKVVKVLDALGRESFKAETDFVLTDATDDVTFLRTDNRSTLSGEARVEFYR